MAEKFDWRAYDAQLWSAFPYERVEVPGAQALETWTRLRSGGRGWPIVIGDDRDFVSIAEPVVGHPHHPPRTPQDILTAAAGLPHPDALRRMRREEEEQLRAYAPEQLRQGTSGDLSLDEQAELHQLADEGSEDPEVGEWPGETAVVGYLGLSAAEDTLRRRPRPKVHIIVLPTQISFEAPAYLRWGGWNACPSSEYIVSALRSWQERFGAEVIGMTNDAMNIRVTRRPASRQEALALAREQYDFCDVPGPIGGPCTLSALAAALMSDDWWHFWWD